MENDLTEKVLTIHELRRWALERTINAHWSSTSERLKVAEEYVQWVLKGEENE